MARQCSICAGSQVMGIDDDLAAGLSIRATARKWRVSRDALARHVRAGHAAAATLATPPQPRDSSALAADLRSPDPATRFEAAFTAALQALDWAQSNGTLPLVLRAQAGTRAALRQSLRLFREGVRRAPHAPSEEELERLERSYLQAVEAFEQSVGRGPLELAALAGLRAALAEMREAAGAVTHPIQLYISIADSPPKLLTTISAWQLPPKWRKGGVIDLRLTPPPHLVEFAPEPAHAGNGIGNRKEDA